MFYGFAVAWLVPMAYVLILMSREKKLRDEMRRLKSMIETGDRR